MMYFFILFLSQAHADSLQETLDHGLLELARVGDFHRMRKLIAEGAENTQTDERGWSAIHFTSKHCDLKTTRLLLANGAPLNGKTEDGTTPLILAAENACPRLVEYLVSHRKIELTARDEKLKTAFDYADENWILGFDMTSIDLLKAALSKKTMRVSVP